MDRELFESLLYRDESETLDFKVEQYHFDKGTDDEKAELLKDLLAFGNAWRTTDAYVLLGVEEKRGGRSIVRGVSQHLLNRNLQQFVLSKTNRPLTFSYSGLKVEDREVGVLTIPVQERPLYLLKNFGRLQANVVYIRRSDATGIATPDEVFRMGRTFNLASKQPDLTWEFTDLEKRIKCGAKLDVVSQYALLPPLAVIPSYGSSSRSPLQTDLYPLVNRDYYKQLARWVNETMLLQPVGLMISNAATVSAENAVLTLEFESDRVVAMSESQMPIKPNRNGMPMIRTRRPPEPRRVEVDQFGAKYEIRCYMGTVQPGMTAWATEPFYLGARETTTIIVTATASADNLSIPQVSNAEIYVEAVAREISVKDLINFR
jgi:hypothetical protein